MNNLIVNAKERSEYLTSIVDHVNGILNTYNTKRTHKIGRTVIQTALTMAYTIKPDTVLWVAALRGELEEVEKFIEQCNQQLANPPVDDKPVFDLDDSWKGYTIVYRTGNSIEPSWYEMDGSPRLYMEKKKATMDMLEDFESTLSDQIEQVRRKERDIDDVDTDFDEWIEEVFVLKDGTVVTVEDKTILYQPKSQEV